MRASTSYDPACDVDHDGDVDIFDIQLPAGHWNQTGTWLSDNDHNHLGQTWVGSNNTLKIEGAFSAPDHAALVLSNSTWDGLRVTSAGQYGVNVESAPIGFRMDTAGTNGVYVASAGTNGMFVSYAGADGFHVSTTGNNGVWVGSAGLHGVFASSRSSDWFGGYFRNTASGGGGVYALGGGNAAPDLVLGGQGSSDDGRIYSEPSLTDSDILLFTNDEAHVHLDEDNNSASTFTVYNGTNTSVWSVGETGITVAAGPSAVQVDTGSEGQRLAYAVTSPQNWIEDFGSGQLEDGEAVIDLEPIYAKALSAEQPYHVFLTPLGDCALYVAEKGVDGFTVRALGGEKCSIAFDYRIVGLRRGYETVRMEQYVEVSDE